MICAAAMNSAPSSRYRTASEPITPTSDSALEIGCVCTTTLMAETTATAAKTMNTTTSGEIAISETAFKEPPSRKPGHQQAGHQQIEHRHREEKLPREAHQLVVTEPRQRAADPHERE